MPVRRTLAVLLLLTMAPAVPAELAPWVYEELQRKSPELLQVEILDVEIDRSFQKPSGRGFFASFSETRPKV